MAEEARASAIVTAPIMTSARSRVTISSRASCSVGLVWLSWLSFTGFASPCFLLANVSDELWLQHRGRAPQYNRV